MFLLPEQPSCNVNSWSKESETRLFIWSSAVDLNTSLPTQSYVADLNASSVQLGRAPGWVPVVPSRPLAFLKTCVDVCSLPHDSAAPVQHPAIPPSITTATPIMFHNDFRWHLFPKQPNLQLLLGTLNYSQPSWEIWNMGSFMRCMCLIYLRRQTWCVLKGYQQTQLGSIQS